MKENNVTHRYSLRKRRQPPTTDTVTDTATDTDTACHNSSYSPRHRKRRVCLSEPLEMHSSHTTRDTHAQSPGSFPLTSPESLLDSTRSPPVFCNDRPMVLAQDSADPPSPLTHYGWPGNEEESEEEKGKASSQPSRLHPIRTSPFLLDRPVQRSLVSELMMHTTEESEEEEKDEEFLERRKSFIQSFFETEEEEEEEEHQRQRQRQHHHEGEEEEEEGEEEGDLLPAHDSSHPLPPFTTRRRPSGPADTTLSSSSGGGGTAAVYDDDIDAFFSSSCMEEHPPEFVLSSAYKMSLLHTQSSRPHYITLAPHFLTQDYFEAHGPAEMGETDTCLETGHRSHYADQFTHMALLGSGHDATVSKVREVATGKVYAVKQTRQPFMSQQDRWLQLAEVECLYAVRESQHCVALLSAWEQEGYLFMQMELCASGSLKDYVNYQQGQVQEKVLWPILHALLKGLESIHKANIIHLDLKPSNILLHQSGQLKIADFGYSMKWGGEDTRETKGEGDRRYMAPDLLKGQFVMAADIYSLGLILLEMASRTVLPDTGDAWESLRVGDYSEYPMLYVSASLQQLIEWLLILHPKQRPTAHDVLAHPDMQEYTAHPPTHPFDGYIQALERLAVEEEERLSHQNIYHTPEMKAEYCWY